MTREQKQIIEQLKQEFQLLNSKKESKKGIISIAELVDRQDKLINRNNEIELMQKAHDNARNLQILNDIEKLRPEIEALGLAIKPMSQGILICLPNADNPFNYFECVEIQYEYTRLEKLHNDFYEYNYYKEVQSNPKLTFNSEAKYYGNPSFDTIEEFVKYEKFRGELGSLYRKTKIS